MKKVILTIEEVITYQREVELELSDDMSINSLDNALRRADIECCLSAEDYVKFLHTKFRITCEAGVDTSPASIKRVKVKSLYIDYVTEKAVDG